MNKLIKIVLLVATLSTVSAPSFATFKRFEAPMDESEWRFNGSPLACTLRHNIPLYGDATFAKDAGRSKALVFSLAYARHAIPHQEKATVRSLAPAWQPFQTGRELGEVALASGEHIIRSRETASWRLLNELEVGRIPTFYYQDFNQTEDQVSVSLSSIGFKQAYEKFLGCLTTLVPFELNELKKMTLYFDFDGTSVKTSYRDRLAALAAYIRHDPGVDVVFLRGHTDSKGSRSYNQKLSQERIESVKNLLSLDGVDPDRFKLQAFGEKNPIASNRSAAGRAKNRRVYIQIAQK